MRRLLFTFLFAFFATPAFLHAADPLIIHEWGTFTSLQDEAGRTLGGINVDDEPLPPFVHQLSSSLTFVQHAGDKGAGAPNRPDVTMRLETPVLYFHPQPNAPMPSSIDITVQFKGGWLTQFYPYANAQIDNANPKPNLAAVPIRDSSVSSLTWKKIQFPIDYILPNTTDHVWLAPRNVSATPISTSAEAEKFLFYRGVAQLDAPLFVTRDIRNQLFLHTRPHSDPIPGPYWLVDIRDDGSVAYRPFTNDSKQLADFQATTSANFTDANYRKENLSALRQAMHAQLVKAGLYADEADALLNTWELSYFKSPGQRLFFLVPQKWTNAILPLTASIPCQINRVMVGRIELITPHQRAILSKIDAQPNSPAFPQLYQSLGRFRTAILIDHHDRQYAASTRPVAMLSR